MLLARKNLRRPICSDEDALDTQDIILDKLGSVLKNKDPDGCVFMSDPKGQIPDYDIVDLSEFIQLCAMGEEMYELGETLGNGWDMNYASFKKKFIIIHIQVPEQRIDLEFYLKAFMFPNQTSDHYPIPTWRAGSMVVHTPSMQRGWFHQIRWRMDE